MSINRAPFNALVDDDGSNTVGTPWTKTIIASSLLDPIDAALATEVTSPSTGNIDNIAVAGNVLRMNNATLATIRGIIAGTPGALLVIISVGAGQVDLAHQNTNSSAANRLINPATSGVTSLAPGTGTAIYEYDGTAARWRLVHHEQGAWIDVPFVAGNFTAISPMTWTVQSGDQTTFKYRLQGRTLQIMLALDATTVGGTLSYQLKAAIPAGFVPSAAISTTIGFLSDSGVGTLCKISPFSGLLSITRVDGANFTNSVNSTVVYGMVTVEVT